MLQGGSVLIKQPAILFIESGASGKGGSFVSLLQIIALLSKKNYQLYVVLWNDSPFIKEYEALGAQVFRIHNPVYTINKNRLKFLYDKLKAVSLRYFPSFLVWLELLLQYSSYKAVLRLARNKNILLIHLNNQPVRNFLGFWIGKRLRLPIIVHLRTLHCYGFTLHHKRFIEKLNCKMIAVSNSAAACWIDAGIPSSWITGLMNPYDGKLIKNSEEKVHSPKKLVFLGRLELGKGVDFLIQSFAKIVKIRPELSLTLIGDGSCLDELYQLSSHLGVSHAVHFSGYQKNAKQYLSEYDMLILPSQGEGFGRVIIEAMAQGLCVIATSVGGIQDIVENEVNGLLVKYGDQEALMSAILLIIENKVLRVKMIKNGYQTIEKKFQENAFCENLISQYNQLI